MTISNISHHIPAAAALLALYWLLAPAVFAYYQGQVMPTLRSEPPASPAAARNSRALHLGFTAVYLLPCLPYLAAPAPLWWLCPALALLGRAALFDTALAYGETGRFSWGAGATAASDKALARLPAWARPALKLGCLLAYGGLVGVAAFHA